MRLLASRNAMLVTLLVPLFVGATAQAQPTQPQTLVDSLEWMTAQSAVVVRATITKVIEEPKENSEDRFTIIAKVSETLKGDHQDTLTFVVSDIGHTAQDWRDKGEDLLLFMERGTHFPTTNPKEAKPFLSLRCEDWRSWKSAVIELSGRSKREVLTADGSLLTDGQEILAAVKTAISEAKHLKRQHNITWILELPLTVEKGVHAPWLKYERESDLGIFLTVPVDLHLEELALRWLKTNNRQLRTLAMSSLRFFKSETNAALVKPLLDDPDFVDVVRSNGQAERCYPIRMSAFSLFKNWGIDVPKPVMIVPTPKP